MITGNLKSQIDKLWEDFWTGGITNPLTVIEQISFLMYARLLDMRDTANEKKAAKTKKAFNRFFNNKQQHLRWQKLIHIESADELFKIVRDELFPFFKNIADQKKITVQASKIKTSVLFEFMNDAQLMIQKPSLLVKAIEAVNDLPLDTGDTKGDLYEYLLSKLNTAGINGQFRTPRHIIRTMVELINPKATDTICDPACGTGGFLTNAYEFMVEKYTSKDGIVEEEVVNDEGNTIKHKIYTGDELGSHRKHVDEGMFHGFDFDVTMLRIAAMNLNMHGVAAPDIHYQDTLSQNFNDRFNQTSKNAFNIILANPPFKGSLDAEDVADDLKATVKTKKTELLFIALILRLLKTGGRAAVIVPDGVLFGSSKAHVQLRKTLIEDNQLEAVISLPSGVFKPYAGVSTAILMFTKEGATENIWFYDVTADGFSLDDKRTQVDNNDLPNLIKQWQRFQSSVLSNDTKQIQADFGDKKKQAFVVAKADIVNNNYDLSLNRYKEIVYEQETYEPPKDILKQLMTVEEEIMADLKELEEML